VNRYSSAMRKDVEAIKRVSCWDVGKVLRSSARVEHVLFLPNVESSKMKRNNIPVKEYGNGPGFEGDEPRVDRLYFCAHDVS